MSKWVGIKAKEVRTRLTDEKSLPSVDEARVKIANDITARLNTIFQEQGSVFKIRMEFLEEKRHVMTCQHGAERQKLDDTQSLHWQDKQQEWKKNYNKGIRGLFDRITGKRKTIEKCIERLQALKSHRLDELEHDVSQYQDMREQRIEQLEKQRQEQSRDRPQPRPDWTH